MNDFPDFSQHGYQVIRELGRNREGGRITYLASTLNSDQQVVIKEFRFAIADASWSGFKAYQREIEVMQQLDHPRIPRYLDSFETAQGFSLVQEYKNALSLAVRRSFTRAQIQQIAVSVLEILVYLQKRIPPVIHRDIKPENILVDRELNAYLVDFGLARIRGGTVAVSSVAAGTPGFMPPEEQFGRPLTEASDLYSLGATLICLLTGTRSLDIGNLIDDNYRFDIKKLVPQCNPRFVQWLTKLVEPNLKNRFNNAAVALTALRPLPGTGKANLLDSIGLAIKLRLSDPVARLLTVFFLLSSGFIAYLQVRANHTDKLALSESSDTNKPASNLIFKQLLESNHTCRGCDLQNADLRGKDLSNADLIRADLRRANLREANLSGANMMGANLERADLRGANLERVYLAGILWPTSVDPRNPRECFKGANLTKANLEGANLEGANLQELKSGVPLNNPSNYDYCDRRPNLTDANLAGANLRGAHLQRAILNRTNLKGAIMPDGTKVP